MSLPKRVLLIYSYYHHHAMVERLASEMEAFGIAIDTLCTNNYSMLRRTGVKLPRPACIYLWIVSHFSFIRQRKFSRKLFYNKLFRDIARRYDLVDFHVFAPSRLQLMMVCQEQSIPYDITLWGSDILRSDSDDAEKKRVGFDNCRYIKGADALLAAVKEKYPGRYDDKFRPVYWGMNDFEAIDAVGGDIVASMRASLPDGPCDCIIACGYNAMPTQYHQRILESLATLPDTLKSRIIVLLQMTYPSDPEYVREVKDAALKSGLRFKLFDSRLSAEEVAAVRKLSDIVVNMQLTDAFAASLQGHLYAGGILIAGKWLDYPVLDDDGIFHIKADFDTLADTVSEVVQNLEHYKSQCAGNREKMKARTSWPAVVGKWAESYKD